jgi:hypothetical protein
MSIEAPAPRSETPTSAAAGSDELMLGPKAVPPVPAGCGRPAAPRAAGRAGRRPHRRCIARPAHATSHERASRSRHANLGDTAGEAIGRPADVCAPSGYRSGSRVGPRDAERGVGLRSGEATTRVEDLSGEDAAVHQAVAEAPSRRFRVAGKGRRASSHMRPPGRRLQQCGKCMSPPTPAWPGGLCPPRPRPRACRPVPRRAVREPARERLRPGWWPRRSLAQAARRAWPHAWPRGSRRGVHCGGGHGAHG